MNQERVSLDAVRRTGGNLRFFDVLPGSNLGNRTLLVAMPMREFHDQSAVANEETIEDRPEFAGQAPAQRPLDKNHAASLASYMLRGIVKSAIGEFKLRGESAPASLAELQRRIGDQAYISLQPITVNLRKTDFGNFENLYPKKNAEGVVVGYQIGLASHHTLMVVDGQHRRFAMDMLYEYVKDLVQFHNFPSRNSQVYPAGEKGAAVTADELIAWNLVHEQLSGQNTVMVEIHLGLDAVQERQLFHDLNKLVKKVAASLALKFDTANPINQFVNEHLVESNLVQVTDSDVSDWHSDKGAITRKDLTAINAFLFIGTASEKKATPIDIEESKEIAMRFWTQVMQIEGLGQVGARAKTVAAQPVVLKALAKLLRQLLRLENGRQLAVDLLNAIPKIDFEHTNPLWRYYQFKNAGALSEEFKQQFAGLDEYMPSDDEGYNRDIGSFDNQMNWFRFSPRTNDVVPLLGDMFRWMIKAPSRNAKS
jgi:hypothetical protein